MQRRPLSKSRCDIGSDHFGYVYMCNVKRQSHANAVFQARARGDVMQLRSGLGHCMNCSKFCVHRFAPRDYSSELSLPEFVVRYSWLTRHIIERYSAQSHDCFVTSKWKKESITTFVEFSYAQATVEKRQSTCSTNPPFVSWIDSRAMVRRIIYWLCWQITLLTWILHARVCLKLCLHVLSDYKYSSQRMICRWFNGLSMYFPFTAWEIPSNRQLPLAF